MLAKLTKIATFLDINDEFITAAQIDKHLIKNAGIFDAIKTLIDPSYADLDNGASYWNRLIKGFRKGRVDKRLGQIFSLSIERERIDKNINELAAPVVEYKKTVDDFYNKLVAKTIEPQNVKGEISNLKISLRKMMSLLSSRTLANLLKRREVVHSKLRFAVEQLKVLSPEAKTFLIQTLSAAGPKNEDIVKEVKKVPVETEQSEPKENNVIPSSTLPASDAPPKTEPVKTAPKLKRTKVVDDAKVVTNKTQEPSVANDEPKAPESNVEVEELRARDIKPLGARKPAPSPASTKSLAPKSPIPQPFGEKKSMQSLLNKKQANRVSFLLSL